MFNVLYIVAIYTSGEEEGQIKLKLTVPVWLEIYNMFSLP